MEKRSGFPSIDQQRIYTHSGFIVEVHRRGRRGDWSRWFVPGDDQAAARALLESKVGVLDGFRVLGQIEPPAHRLPVLESAVSAAVLSLRPALPVGHEISHGRPASDPTAARPPASPDGGPPRPHPMFLSAPKRGDTGPQAALEAHSQVLVAGRLFSSPIAECPSCGLVGVQRGWCDRCDQPVR